MINKNVELEINLLEELSDADLMTVIGGGGTDTVGTLTGDLTGTLANSGNNTKPTSTLVGGVIGGTVTTIGGYISNNGAGFAEELLQGVNRTAVDAGNSV